MNLEPTPQAIEARLMIMIGDEIRITDAGLFALCGLFAADDSLDEKTRRHNGFAILRVLDVARASGFEAHFESALHQLFIEKVSPFGDSEKSLLLASLCRLVAATVGKGRMGQLIEGKKSH